MYQFIENGDDYNMKRILSKLKENQMAFVFCIANAVTLACLTVFLFASHGELIERFFFYDTIDTGMDFFHSIEYVNGLQPYERFYTLYPPLVNFLLRGCSRWKAVGGV